MCKFLIFHNLTSSDVKKAYVLGSIIEDRTNIHRGGKQTVQIWNTWEEWTDDGARLKSSSSFSDMFASCCNNVASIF